MKVSEIMTRDVFLASPGQNCARLRPRWRSATSGAALSDSDRLLGYHGPGHCREGISTPRSEASVRDVMSASQYCFEDDEIDDSCPEQAVDQIRRLPVLNDKKRLVALLPSAIWLRAGMAGATGVALSGISQAVATTSEPCLVVMSKRRRRLGKSN